MANKLIIPNYKDGSIVNLMSSISNSFNTKSKYGQLKGFSSKELKEYQNVVLLVMDGLGYNFLKKYPQSELAQHLRRRIDAVFPPTTSASIPTFFTGVAPQQHGMVSWYMNMKEIGAVSNLLVGFVKVVSGVRFKEIEVDHKDLFDQESLFHKIKAQNYLIGINSVVNSDFNKLISGNAKRIVVKSLGGFFNQTKKAVKSSNRRKFIHSYWGEFDALSHKYGSNSRQAIKEFRDFDKRFGKFIKSLRGTNTAVILTSDHGFMDVSKDRNRIRLDDHPKLDECLTVPLCGEPRTVFCYVRPSKTKQFEKYIKTHFKGKMDLYKSGDLIKKNLFGKFAPNKKLFDRIGDYTLLLREGYNFKDKLANKKEYKFHIGGHGGNSEDEIRVPLVFVGIRKYS